MKHLAIAVALLVGVLLGAAVACARNKVQPGPSRTQRIMQFENDDVKVWKSIVVPHAPLTMHRHEHGRVIIRA